MWIHGAKQKDVILIITEGNRYLLFPSVANLPAVESWFAVSETLYVLNRRRLWEHRLADQISRRLG